MYRIQGTSHRYSVLHNSVVSLVSLVYIQYLRISETDHPHNLDRHPCHIQIHTRNYMFRILICLLFFQPLDISLFKIKSQLIIYIIIPVSLIFLDPCISEYRLHFCVRHRKCEYVPVDCYFVVQDIDMVHNSSAPPSKKDPTHYPDKSQFVNLFYYSIHQFLHNKKEQPGADHSLFLLATLFKRFKCKTHYIMALTLFHLPFQNFLLKYGLHKPDHIFPYKPSCF